MADFWNGATISWSAYSGSFQSIGPVTRTRAVADVTPTSQVQGIKKKIVSRLADAGEIQGVTFLTTGAAHPGEYPTGTSDITQHTVTLTLDALKTTTDALIFTAKISVEEINEVTSDGVRMLTLTLVPIGGTAVGESTNAADSTTYTDWFHRIGA